MAIETSTVSSEDSFRAKLHDLLARPVTDRDLLIDFLHAALYYAMTTKRLPTILNWFRLQIQSEMLSAEGQTLANCRFVRGYLRGYATAQGRNRIAASEEQN